jgi:hypothetical protein
MAASWLLWVTSHICPEQPHCNLHVAHRPVFCNKYGGRSLYIKCFGLLTTPGTFVTVPNSLQKLVIVPSKQFGLLRFKVLTKRNALWERKRF